MEANEYKDIYGYLVKNQIPQNLPSTLSNFKKKAGKFEADRERKILKRHGRKVVNFFALINSLNIKIRQKS